MLRSFPSLPHKYVFKSHVPLAQFCCFQAPHSSAFPWHATPLQKSSKARDITANKPGQNQVHPRVGQPQTLSAQLRLQDPSKEQLWHQTQGRVKFWWLLSPGLSPADQQYANQPSPLPAGDGRAQRCLEGLDTFLPRSPALAWERGPCDQQC